MPRDGNAELEAMIAKIRSIPGLARRAAPDVADAVRAELVRTIEAGTTPAGVPWQPRQDDGGKPLAEAVKALRVAPIGTRIFCLVRGHIARHHLGRARGGIYRNVLPIKGIPAPMVKAIRGVLVEHFNGTVQGGG
jgi:hypothetical protein